MVIIMKESTNVGTVLRGIPSRQGQTIEQRMEKMLDSNEQITDGAPLIFTERKDGRLPAYDIRRDGWEEAVGVLDKTERNNLVVKENLAKKEAEGDTKGEPTHATE